MGLRRLKLALAPPVWRALTRTWQLNLTDESGPVIFACLHRDILPAICHCRPAGPVLLVSKSDDGQILIRTLAREGFRFVRGSTGHDGREGFRGLLRALRDGRAVGVAVDGPRGPFGHVHPGALQLARLSGAPIVPLTVSGRRCLRLRTWDRTLVPLPGARLTVTAGAPLVVPPHATAAELTRCTARLAATLIAEGDPP